VYIDEFVFIHVYFLFSMLVVDESIHVLDSIVVCGGVH
jgi:hypothetical protein